MALSLGAPPGRVCAATLGPESSRREDRLQRHYERLEREGAYGSAIPLAQKRCRIIERALDEHSAEVAACASHLGALYTKQGQYALAAASFARALSIPGFEPSASVLSDKAELHLAQAEYDAAQRALDRALEQITKSRRPNPLVRARILSNLGALQMARAEFESATPLLQQALALYDEAGGHPDVAVCLTRLAGIHRKEGATSEAEPLLKRAISSLEGISGPEHPLLAVPLTELATLYYMAGRHDEALPLFERALAIRENALGPAHPEVALTLNNMGTLFERQGRYDDSRRVHERALSIRERSLRSDHPLIAYSLNNLARLYDVRGDYRIAQPLFERALEILERSLGAEHTDVASALSGLALTHMHQGRLDTAVPMLERALRIYEQRLPANSPGVGGAMLEIASAYALQGRFADAQRLFERALKIFEGSVGPDHVLVAGTLNNMSVMYDDLGDYERAEAAAKRAIAIYEKALGPAHPHIAFSLNNLGLLHKDQRELEEAELLFRRALSIYERSLGPEHIGVAASLNNLAMIHIEKGEYEQATRLSARTLSILDGALEPDHPHIASTLDNFAAAYLRLKDNAEAEQLFERALSIRIKTLGSQHPLTAKSIHRLGHLHSQTGDRAKALTFHSQAADIEQSNMVRTLAFADESRKLAYASMMRSSTRVLLSFHLTAGPNDRSAAELAFTTLLRRKGRVQDLVAQSFATLRRSLPPEHRHLLTSLTEARAWYSALANRGIGGDSIEDYARELSELQDEQDRVWAELAEVSPRARAVSEPITIDELRRVMPAHSVLVEFVRYRPQHDDRGAVEWDAGPPRYAAYLLFRDHLDWVDLGPAQRVDAQISAMRASLATQRDDIETQAEALFDVVMADVLDRLPRDTRQLFIAPDAELNTVPFGALHDGRRYLLENYALRYVSTGRDLLRPWHVAGDSGASDDVIAVVNPSGAHLLGTETEAELLATLFPTTRTLRGPDATEARVLDSARPWILHLGTHGFFGTGHRGRNLFDPALEARTDEMSGALRPAADLDNPMLYSGLVLARGVDTDLHDDRLTAYEVSGWDLRGTQLVTLSACDSGLGEIQAGEGIMGLRRAFVLAGAQTQVMSLWKVDDDGTSELMSAFYRNLAEGRGRGEAMQRTQLRMLDRGDYRHPHYWAAFVTVGEWAPLDFPDGSELPIHSRGGCRASLREPSGSAPSPLLLLCLLGLARRRVAHGSGAVRNAANNSVLRPTVSG